MFTNTKGLAIPQGTVTKIEKDGVVLWSIAEESFEDVYQQVEWIQADTDVGAYLDLGFAFDTGAVMEYSQYITDTQNTYVFGSAENSGKLRCMITSPYYIASKYNCYFYGSSGSAYISATCTYKLNAWNYYTYTLEKGNLNSYNSTTDYTASKTTQGSYTMTNNLYLFAQNYNGTARFGGARRIGYFKYYDSSGVLICDLVPCYRKSDGVIGMYDLVRETFLTNVGSGTFTKGADV